MNPHSGLTFKITNQSFSVTLQLTMMQHHNTITSMVAKGSVVPKNNKYGCKRFNGSKDVMVNRH